MLRLALRLGLAAGYRKTRMAAQERSLRGLTERAAARRRSADWTRETLRNSRFQQQPQPRRHQVSTRSALIELLSTSTCHWVTYSGEAIVPSQPRLKFGSWLGLSCVVSAPTSSQRKAPRRAQPPSPTGGHLPPRSPGGERCRAELLAPPRGTAPIDQEWFLWVVYHPGNEEGMFRLLWKWRNSDYILVLIRHLSVRTVSWTMWVRLFTSWAIYSSWWPFDYFHGKCNLDDRVVILIEYESIQPPVVQFLLVFGSYACPAPGGTLIWWTPQIPGGSRTQIGWYQIPSWGHHMNNILRISNFTQAWGHADTMIQSKEISERKLKKLIPLL